MNNSASSRPASTIRQQLARALALVFLAGAVVLGVWHWRDVERNPLSEDAIVLADLVHVSTPVPGRIRELHVQEGSLVEAGQLLFALDDESYRLQVAAARAQLELAKAALATRERSINAEKSNVVVADQQIERARVNLALAEQTLARLRPLAAKGYVTAQQLDDARTLRDNAAASLAQAEAAARAAEDLVGSLEGARAAVQAQEAALALAERALADTRVYAPHAGRVVGLNVTTGEYIAPDQSVFTLIVTNKWYASALFRETVLGRIHDGMCATVFVMSQPTVAISGRVVNIGWGVTSTSLLEIPRGLPYVPKSLDWVRVAQRFPVRVLLKDPPADLMRVGASAIVRLHDETDC